jgi:hypothetical protein
MRPPGTRSPGARRSAGRAGPACVQRLRRAGQLGGAGGGARADLGALGSGAVGPGARRLGPGPRRLGRGHGGVVVEGGGGVGRIVQVRTRRGALSESRRRRARWPTPGAWPRRAPGGTVGQAVFLNVAIAAMLLRGERCWQRIQSESSDRSCGIGGGPARQPPFGPSLGPQVKQRRHRRGLHHSIEC